MDFRGKLGVHTWWISWRITKRLLGCRSRLIPGRIAKEPDCISGELAEELTQKKVSGELIVFLRGFLKEFLNNSQNMLVGHLGGNSWSTSWKNHWKNSRLESCTTFRRIFPWELLIKTLEGFLIEFLRDFPVEFQMHVLEKLQKSSWSPRKSHWRTSLRTSPKKFWKKSRMGSPFKSLF